MNFKIIAIASLLVPLCLASSMRAEKADNVGRQVKFQETSACSISGQIYGMNRQEGRSFSVVIFNEDDGEAIGKFPAQAQSPGKPNYEIDLSKSGRYLIRVFRDESGSLFPLRTNPTQRLVECDGNEIKNADFALQSNN